MKCISSLPVIFFFDILFIKTNIWAFRCNSGEIIPDYLFCDRTYNCIDHSDEAYENGCTRRGCRSGKFTCQSTKNCINIKHRCDAINDCDDNSDEVNCGDRSVISNPDSCQLDQGKFLCENKLACIDFSSTCDGKCHCLDCSDENATNCSKLDSTSCSSCKDSCLPTPYGPHCFFCNSSNKESSPICKEIQNCTQQSSDCSQHCTRYGNFQRCLCYEGFHEMPGTDGRECRKNLWLETVLLYSSVSKIKLVNFSIDAIEVVRNNVRCTALAASRDNVYYAEFRNNRAFIRRSSITGGGGKSEEIVELDSRITSVSVDWVTENVYFTSNGSLYVCSPNGGICTQLKCCGINNVVLAPKYGRMFYTQYVMAGEDDQFIMKSNMDGSEEDTFLPDRSFLPPISIALDEDKDTLYLLTKTLYSFSLDGLIKNVHSHFNEMTEPYLSVLDGRAFFTGKRENKVYGTETDMGKLHLPHSFLEYPDNSTSYMRHLHVHNPGLQRTNQVKNVCSEASCNGLCLTRLSSNGLNYTCLCENFTPLKANHWCDKHKQYSSQWSKSASSDSSTETKTTSSASKESYSESTNDADYSSTTTERSEASTTPEEIDVSPNAVPTTASHPIIDIKRETVPWDEPPTSLSKTYDYVVIYSSATKIKAWYAVNDTHRTIQSGLHTTALAGVRGDIYYGSIDNQGHIFKIHMESGQTKELVRVGTRITSISVEWITNNIYFTSNTSLSVCSPDGRICTVLRCCGIDQVTVTSRYQWMFYTQKMIGDDMYLIMRSSLDGSEADILIDDSFLHVVSLTVDESNEKIYWWDTETGSNMLHSVSFTGSGRRLTDVIHYTSSKYSYIAVLEDNLFYASGDQNIEWQNANWSRSYRDKETNTVKFLHAFSPALQNADGIVNPCKQSSCPGLCLLSPTLSTDTARFTCVCENFNSAGENHWCDMNHPVLELNTTVRRIEVPTSTEPMTSITPKQAPRSEDCSSISVAAASMGPLRGDYLVVTGVMGFILGLISASFVMGLILIYQKFSRERNRATYLISGGSTVEMEM